MDGVIDEYSINFEAIGLTPVHIERAMGYEMGHAPDPLPEIIAELLHDAAGYADGHAGARTLPPGDVILAQDTVCLDGIVLHTAAQIAALLTGSESVVVFAATVGHSMDRWIQHFFETGDSMRGYVADTIGSEAVEGVASWLEERIADRAIESSHYTTSRFSPGFCNWDVTDRHALFSLLPAGFCGIQLTENALMLPAKSVSGILGIGTECERLVTACSVCTLETCLHGRA